MLLLYYYLYYFPSCFDTYVTFLAFMPYMCVNLYNKESVSECQMYHRLEGNCYSITCFSACS